MAVDAGYVASQQKRYTDAITANNKDLIGRLEADAKRVGYTLTKPKPAPAPKPTPAPTNTATKAGSALGNIAKAIVPSALDNAIAKAKLEPIVQAANNQTVAQPKPATTTPSPTLDAFVSASQNTQAKPAFNMFTTPVAPSTPTVTAPVTTATPFYNPTPVSTQTTLEKQAGILPTPTPTPTIEAYKAVAPTPVVAPTPTYQDFKKETPQSVVSPIVQAQNMAVNPPAVTPVANQTIAEIIPEVKTVSPIALGAGPITQEKVNEIINTPITDQQAILIQNKIKTGEAPTVFEAFKQAVAESPTPVVVPEVKPVVSVTPEVKAETQAPVVVPEVKAEAPVATAPTKASVRKQLISQPLTFENYKTFLDNISEGEQLSPEETSYLQNMRNEIYKNKDMLEKEMMRTQDVIMERERQGLGIDSQQAYFTKLLSEMKKFEQPIVRATALPEGVPTLTQEGAGLAATVPTAIADVIKQETGQEAPQLTKKAEEIRATALPEDVPTVLPKEEAPTATAIDKPTETKLPEGSTVAVITKPDGSQVDGYVLNGQTFYKDGTRIATGDRVTINGKTYEMGADGKGIDLQKKATDDFLANPNAETWDAFNKSGIGLENLTPEQRKIVEDYRNLTKTNVEENLKEQKRIEDKIMDMKAQELDTTAQERYLSLIRGAYDKLVSGAGVQGQPLTPEQAAIQDRELKSAYERAVAEVDRQNAGQTADLKTQAELATKAFELSKDQQKTVFKEALQNLKDNSFIEQMKTGQAFANRGLLNSGMFTDALVRLGMSANQKIADVASKQLGNLAQQEAKYQATIKTIQDKQQRIVDGREADIEKAFKAIQKDQQTAVKTSQDAFIEQAKILYNTVKTLSSEGMDTQKLNALYADGLQRGDFSGMIQYMGTQDMGLSTKGALDVAKTSKVYADQTGTIWINGKQLKDSKGNPVQSFDAVLAAQKVATDRARITQDAKNIQSKLSSAQSIATMKTALEQLKLEKNMTFKYDSLQKNAIEKNMGNVLELIKQGDRQFQTNIKELPNIENDALKTKLIEEVSSWASTRSSYIDMLESNKGQIEDLINSSGGNIDLTTKNNNVFFNPNQAQSWLGTWKSAK